MDDHPYRGRSDNAVVARDVMATTARFQLLAADIALPSYPIDVEFVRWSAEAAAENNCPGPVTDVMRRIEADDAWLRSLGDCVVGHGDVHFWNAGSEQPDGPWRLLDPSRERPTGRGTPPTARSRWCCWAGPR